VAQAYNGLRLWCKMNNQSDRRNFNRFPITFQIEVAAKDSEGNGVTGPFNG